MKSETDKFIAELFEERPQYDDGGAGTHNAFVLKQAGVRPAFFDTSCLLYRLMYAKSNEYCKQAGDNDILLTHLMCCDFVRDVSEACSHFGCSPVLCFDSKVSFRRQQVFDRYKLRDQRKSEGNETRVFSLKPQVIRTLQQWYAPAYKIQTFCVNGYESDDLLASFVLGLKQHFLMKAPVYESQVVVVSNDHDIHQLVIEGVHFADVTTGVMATAEQIYRHTGIHPRHVVAAKTIGGCKSDTIPGVSQCGKKTVLEIISTSGNTNVKLKRARKSLQSDATIEILRRNLRLVRLPFEGNPPLIPLRLSAKVWPVAGVPDAVAERLNEMFHGAIRDLPGFVDLSKPRVISNGGVKLHTCKYEKKGVGNSNLKHQQKLKKVEKRY